ncbi:hypothetical protein [Nostoc sphaeroides]|uniref:Uncharacterized protein n=1 Tax=Nostoc sphaeroides CCNUC1 TaxID=2653204 RepID=A0A5P8VYX8_9NOSO|nr:hypothetical protein [Nostoc sphaeroides]QFS45316.1 hypothetical protein GXM_02793 [Nostoc sphaeroides CCNUC1]
MQRNLSAIAIANTSSGMKVLKPASSKAKPVVLFLKLATRCVCHHGKFKFPSARFQKKSLKNVN